MKPGDKVVFNENARPESLQGVFATVLLASDTSAVVLPDLKDEDSWFSGKRVQAPLEIIDLVETKED